ncbi:BrnA antitoxin family protein [Methylobacterium sp. GC_Met_2]|uniref:BrnA antitoxin family protein n=1 Tax=Methylobacterium sp. GC_Met_2 TaxID=2937376 RepID=UPI00226B066A
MSTVPEVSRLLPKRQRGRPRRVDAKVNLTLRIDPALLDAYRATGDGWQVRMHEALAEGIGQSKPAPAAGDKRRA